LFYIYIYIYIFVLFHYTNFIAEQSCLMPLARSYIKLENKWCNCIRTQCFSSTCHRTSQCWVVKRTV